MLHCKSQYRAALRCSSTQTPTRVVAGGEKRIALAPTNTNVIHSHFPPSYFVSLFRARQARCLRKLNESEKDEDDKYDDVVWCMLGGEWGSMEHHARASLARSYLLCWRSLVIHCVPCIKHFVLMVGGYSLLLSNLLQIWLRFNDNLHGDEQTMMIGVTLCNFEDLLESSRALKSSRLVHSHPVSWNNSSEVGGLLRWPWLSSQNQPMIGDLEKYSQHMWATKGNPSHLKAPRDLSNFSSRKPQPIVSRPETGARSRWHRASSSRPTIYRTCNIPVNPTERHFEQSSQLPFRSDPQWLMSLATSCNLQSHSFWDAMKSVGWRMQLNWIVCRMQRRKSCKAHH